MVPLVIPKEFLLKNEFHELQELINFQGWESLCSKPALIDPDQVRAFYSQFHLLTGTETSNPVACYIGDGDELTFNSSLIRKLLQIPAEGFHTLPTKAWQGTEGRVTILNKLFKKVPTVGKELMTHGLSLTGKMAHQYITRVVVPRQEKRTTVNTNDAILLDLFLRQEKINLPRIIIGHMGKCAAKPTHALPYAALVK